MLLLLLQQQPVKHESGCLFSELISRFNSLRILVLGDFMLDHYVMGRVDRISPEAPVPVVDVEAETFRLGGAGNVVMNALGIRRSNRFHLVLLETIGPGNSIRELLSKQNITSDGLIESSRPTTLKTRILAHQQQVVRVDREQRIPIDATA